MCVWYEWNLSGTTKGHTAHPPIIKTEKMMKSISELKDLEEISARIGLLQPEAKGLWGVMNVNQMLCHVSDPVRGALGERTYKDISNLFTSTFAKWIFLYLFPFPKNAPTGREFNQVKGSGTPVKDFESDRKELLRLLQQLHVSSPSAKLIGHPLFGNMSNWEWGRITYLHLDHHLKQFGV